MTRFLDLAFGVGGTASLIPSPIASDSPSFSTKGNIALISSGATSLMIALQVP